ncbi:MAG: hypothetical protein JWM80_3639 [Cyanobacteria bacterium RYN_339]|nr:hypothetical protein [Cyanobacteria bacterium RYN_339]
MNETQPTPAQYELFKVRVAAIVRDLWEGYKERHEKATELGQPWDDLAERHSAANVAGTPLEIFDLTGDGLVSEWLWDGSDVELAEYHVRDATSAFPTGQYPVPPAKLHAIIALTNDQFLRARAMARRRAIGEADEPQAGLA